MFLSVISKCLYWHKPLPTSGEKKVQKPLHTSVCQIFANTSSPAGLAAKAIPVMAAVAAAATPDAVAGVVWQDLNTQCNTHLCQCLGVWAWNCQMKKCVLNCPHSDSQLLGECGFWIVSKLKIFFFPHVGANTTWRVAGILNRVHWLEKLFPADTSIFYFIGWKLPGLL